MNEPTCFLFVTRLIIRRVIFYLYERCKECISQANLMQNLHFSHSSCIYAIFFVPSVLPTKAGSHRKYVRVLPGICKGEGIFLQKGTALYLSAVISRLMQA